MPGSRFETKKNNGVSHFLEHMLYRGTPTLPRAHDVNLAFERLGEEIIRQAGGSLLLERFQFLFEFFLMGEDRFQLLGDVGRTGGKMRADGGQRGFALGNEVKRRLSRDGLVLR